MKRCITSLICINILFLTGCSRAPEEPEKAEVAINLNEDPSVTLSDDVMDPKFVSGRNCMKKQAKTVDVSNLASNEALKDLQMKAINGTASDQLQYANALLAHRSPQLDKIAFYWIQYASQSETAEAQFMLGYLYFAGIGTPVNHTKSAQLFAPLAQSNIPQAQYYLAKIYFEGQGVKKDLDLAKKWITEAIRSQLPEAYPLANQIITAEQETNASNHDLSENEFNGPIIP